MAKTQFGTFDELLDITPEELRPIANRLKELVLEVHPDTCEVVRLGERAATYGLGPKKMSEGYTYILPHKSWVNLGFFKGAFLADSSGLMEGSGKSLRHIKVRSMEIANQPEIKELIQLALSERKEALAKD